MGIQAEVFDTPVFVDSVGSVEPFDFEPLECDLLDLELISFVSRSDCRMCLKKTLSAGAFAHMAPICISRSVKRKEFPAAHVTSYVSK
jgi:hypothetical protein